MIKRIAYLFLLAVSSLTLLSSTVFAAASDAMHHAAPMPMMSMTSPQWDGNMLFDKWFLDNMIPHHQQAVMMSRMLSMHTKRTEMKALGNDIIQAQMTEIEQMQNWRTQWFNTQPLTTHPGMMKDMTGIMRMDCSSMMSHTPQMTNMDMDLWFLDNMILHHQGAIAMSTEALKNAEHPEILALAQSIIASQQKEINMMKQWKSTWYPTAE